MSKKIKISFETINTGIVTEIDSHGIAVSNQRIKNTMTDVVRQYKRNETNSIKHAGTLILNA